MADPVLALAKQHALRIDTHLWIRAVEKDGVFREEDLMICDFVHHFLLLWPLSRCFCPAKQNSKHTLSSSASLTQLTQFSRVHGADPSIPSKTTSPPAFSADLDHGDASKPAISAGERTLVAVAVTTTGDERKNKAVEAITASRRRAITPAGRTEKGGES